MTQSQNFQPNKLKYLTRVQSGQNTIQQPHMNVRQNANVFNQNPNIYPHPHQQQQNMQIVHNGNGGLQYQDPMMEHQNQNIQYQNQMMQQMGGMGHPQAIPPGYLPPNVQNTHYMTDPGYMMPGPQQVMTEQQLINEHQMALQMAQMQVQIGQLGFAPNLGRETPANFQSQMANMQVPKYQEEHIDLPPHLRKQPQNYTTLNNQPSNNTTRMNQAQKPPAHFQSQKRRKKNHEAQGHNDRPQHDPNTYIHHSEPQNMITPAMQAPMNAVKPKEDIIKSIKSYQQLNQESSNSRKNSKVQNVF